MRLQTSQVSHPEIEVSNRCLSSRFQLFSVHSHTFLLTTVPLLSPCWLQMVGSWSKYPQSKGIYECSIWRATKNASLDIVRVMLIDLQHECVWRNLDPLCRYLWAFWLPDDYFSTSVYLNFPLRKFCLSNLRITYEWQNLICSISQHYDIYIIQVYHN